MKSTTESVPNGAAEIPVPFEITLPQNTPEFMAPAYFGCLRWALQFDPILESFKEVTGKNIPASRSPIEKLVDEACGINHGEEFIKAFVPWFNEQVWGSLGGPGEN